MADRSRSRSARAAEVLSFAGQSIAPPGVGARYAAFDVTPARYVTAIVTDRAICRPPYASSLRAAVIAARGAWATTLAPTRQPLGPA